MNENLLCTDRCQYIIELTKYRMLEGFGREGGLHVLLLVDLGLQDIPLILADVIFVTPFSFNKKQNKLILLPLK